MSSQSSEEGGSKVDVPAAIFFGLVISSVLYVFALFVSGTIGIVKQLANPATHIEFNVAIVVATAFPLVIFAYLITPELRGRPSARLCAVVVAALSGTIACAGATALLAPSIVRPSPFMYAAASYLLFAGCGFLPTFGIARILIFCNADTQVARRGDHFIDTSKLGAETKRLVVKHTGPSMRRPPGWQPFSLWGDADRLTHDDLRKILALEEAEEKRIAELHRQRAVSAKNEREDAHHKHIQSLPSQQQALFESTLRANVETVKGFTEYRAKAEREIALLRTQNQNLRAAGAGQALSQQVRQEVADIVGSFHKIRDDLESTASARHKIHHPTNK